jgi:hypothetical protein
VSADSAAAADAVPDGVRLAELIESLPLSRGSVFELVKALGIETAKGPGPQGRGRVAWLCAADAHQLTQAAHEVAAGRRRISDFSAALVARPQTPPTLPTLSDAASPDSADGAGLLQRIEAAERAVSTGFPLSTAELAWIIGARPGGPVVVRGGLRAERVARNVWRLSAASPESADPAG